MVIYPNAPLMIDILLIDLILLEKIENAHIYWTNDTRKCNWNKNCIYIYYTNLCN